MTKRGKDETEIKDEEKGRNFMPRVNAVKRSMLSEISMTLISHGPYSLANGGSWNYKSLCIPTYAFLKRPWIRKRIQIAESYSILCQKSGVPYFDGIRPIKSQKSGIFGNQGPLPIECMKAFPTGISRNHWISPTLSAVVISSTEHVLELKFFCKMIFEKF